LEKLYVSTSNALPCPRAMMIIACDANITIAAVITCIISEHVADRAITIIDNSRFGGKQ
jgi:hypothetical protein